MNSFLAHTALGLSFLSAAAVAKPVASLEARLEAQGSSTYLNAELALSYSKKVLDLTLQGSTQCPEGRVCAQVLPEPVDYHFEKVVTTINSCGVVRSKALRDQIPVDGPRIEVNVFDNRGNTCPTFAALPATTMTVSQKYYDRIRGQWVENNDSFASKDSPYQGIYRAQLQPIASETFQGGEVLVDAGKGSVKLTLVERKKKTSYALKNAETEIDSCQIIRTVAYTDSRPEGRFVRVTSNYNLNNICPTFAPLAPLDVFVETIRLDGDREVQTLDSFEAEDVALINPAGK